MLLLLEHRLCTQISVHRAWCQDNFDTKYGGNPDQQIYRQQPDAEPDSRIDCSAEYLFRGRGTGRLLWFTSWNSCCMKIVRPDNCLFLARTMRLVKDQLFLNKVRLIMNMRIVLITTKAPLTPLSQQ